nr:zinc finger protein 354A-like isoform X1 [Megalopta genalis]
MELGEGEAQICRLCGQYESIYIDVFSEEGTKRFLGLKIHSKINILIKENDGLPHVVCLRCIGALEFMCDFYNCCQLTQEELSLSEKSNEKRSSERISDDEECENYFESDKENALPSTNETKRRTKAWSPGKKVPTNDIRSDVPTILQGITLDDRKPSELDDSIVRKRKPKDERINDTGRKCERPKLEKDISRKKATVKDRMPLLVQPKRRRNDRESKLQKLEEAGFALNTKYESHKNVDETECDGNQRKRQCLRTICGNGKSNRTVTNNDKMIFSKSQIELLSENKIPTVSSSKHRKKNDGENALIDGVAEDDSKDRSRKCKPISVIVKQEKVDAERETVYRESVENKKKEKVKSNRLDSIRNDTLIEGRGENVSTIDRRRTTEKIVSSAHSSSRLEDDAKNSDVSTCDTSDHPKSERPPSVEETRATVIRSSRRNPVAAVVGPDVANDNIKNDSDCDSHVRDTENLYRENSFDENKSRDRSFGKISELISEEQKEEIETYYMIDMSTVDSAEVDNNLTVIDKKNIRCNICGSLYPRMDKCQVHIWGHLQMKPFRCKACDFATVTVSNVRCHIRKSHLKIKPFACILCEKKYVTAVLLEEHMNTHTGARPFKCKICDFASSSRQMLSYHNGTHKPSKDIICKICDKRLNSRGKLRAHMIVHNKDKVVMCKLCSAYLSNAEALETHHKNLHMQDYVCNLCGKQMKSRKALHNHQNVHSAAKYKCTLCPNVYKSSQILKEHLLKHEGIRKYKCNVCGKSFGQQSHLAAHMAVHSGIRFHCPGCDKPFNRHDNMKIHTKRCKPFLASPELKNLLIKKERSLSTGKAIKLDEDTTSRNSLNFEAFGEKRIDDERSILKTVGDREETAMKLGLNISCIESPDKSCTRDNVYQKVGELIGSAELNVIQIVETNDKFVSKSDNVTVLETVLGPEVF